VACRDSLDIPKEDLPGALIAHQEFCSVDRVCHQPVLLVVVLFLCCAVLCCAVLAKLVCVSLCCSYGASNMVCAATNTILPAQMYLQCRPLICTELHVPLRSTPGVDLCMSWDGACPAC